jgi:protein gp37
MARRLKAMGQKNYVNGFNVTLHPHALGIPLRWKKPQTVFVNSMSDLFHEDIPLTFIREVFDIMEQSHRHRFQILTKRAERLAELAPLLNWPDNVWIGVTVENISYMNRIDYLGNVSATVRFLSLEPLLSALPDIDLSYIDWVIVGGESGPGARPMDKRWVVDIQQQCSAAKVPFFFKQWGGVNKKKAGRLLNGKIYNEMPNLVNKDQLASSLITS